MTFGPGAPRQPCAFVSLRFSAYPLPLPSTGFCAGVQDLVLVASGYIAHWEIAQTRPRSCSSFFAAVFAVRRIPVGSSPYLRVPPARPHLHAAYGIPTGTSVLKGRESESASMLAPVLLAYSVTFCVYGSTLRSPGVLPAETVPRSVQPRHLKGLLAAEWLGCKSPRV